LRYSIQFNFFQAHYRKTGENAKKTTHKKQKNAIMGNAQCKVNAKLLHRANQLVTKAYAITFTVITYYCRV